MKILSLFLNTKYMRPLIQNLLGILYLSATIVISTLMWVVVIMGINDCKIYTNIVCSFPLEFTYFISVNVIVSILTFIGLFLTYRIGGTKALKQYKIISFISISILIAIELWASYEMQLHTLFPNVNSFIFNIGLSLAVFLTPILITVLYKKSIK